MKSTLSLLLTGFLLLFSCSSDDTTVVPEYHAPAFDLAGANAVMFFLEAGRDTDNGRTSESPGPGNLFKLNAAGEPTPVSWGGSFRDIKPLRKGLFVTHYNQVLGNDVYYVVELDNSVFEMGSYTARLIGENDAGDLIFADAKVFRRATKTVETLNTGFTSPLIESVSGNFATVRVGADFYVLNTVTGKQYPVQNCHGPLIIALDHSQVFVDDCQEGNLLAFASGERQVTGINPFDFSTRTATGVAVLGTAALKEYNAQGLVTFEAPYHVASSVSSVTNSGDYFFINERTGLSVIKRGSTEVKSILPDVNIISFSAAAGILYYVAEQKNRRPVLGIYNLDSGEDKTLPGNATSLHVHAFE